MKELVNHPIYGEIVYSESFWLGKKTLQIDGIDVPRISKKEFMIDGKKATLKGSFLTGVKLLIEGAAIELSPSPKWYEYILAIIPIVFLLTWGNSTTLCSIFPVVGGAIGGGIGGIAATISLFCMKKTKKPTYKILIGLGVLASSVFLGFAVAMMLVVIASIISLSV